MTEGLGPHERRIRFRDERVVHPAAGRHLRAGHIELVVQNPVLLANLAFGQEYSKATATQRLFGEPRLEDLRRDVVR